MKKRTKGIIMFAFLGGIMVTSGVVIAIPGIVPDGEEEITMTGTPEDNFPDAQRAQFCGTGSAKSNMYVTEYKIPTVCSQPLAITTDPQGNVWFGQTNTGKISKFDPTTESFIEYDNPQWPPNGRSMMWGMDYSPDGSIWYTDEAHDSIWRFSIQDESYSRLSYPSNGDSLPQRLQIAGSNIIVNDFTGNKITFLDIAQTTDEISYLTLPSPVENSVTAGFSLDSQNNLWYTNWIFQQDGVLVKYDRDGYEQSIQSLDETSLPLFDFIDIYQLPDGLNTPNGLVVDPAGNIWIAETSSSSFFNFDTDSEDFTKYVTSDPTQITYGNSSGLIKSPVSRPYWTDVSDDGRIVFNEQTANQIAFFDPAEDSLIEYMIPSKNPNWSDCGTLSDCGLAQAFDFTVDGDKVWFTEWVENNIGVVDTSIPLPLEIDIVPQKINLKEGESTELTLQIISYVRKNSQDISIITSTPRSDLIVESETNNLNLIMDALPAIPITITNENVLTGTHKVLVGVQTDGVTISKYVTVTIDS